MTLHEPPFIVSYLLGGKLLQPPLFGGTITTTMNSNLLCIFSYTADLLEGQPQKSLHFSASINSACEHCPNLLPYNNNISTS